MRIDHTLNPYPTFEAACAAQDADAEINRIADLLCESRAESVQTHVVHVTVKIDSKKSDASREALEVIGAALVSFYGGEEGGWHPWHTVSRHGGPREVLQSISLEGARL